MPGSALPTLQDRLDSTGFGPYHVVVSLLLMAVWFADGVELHLTTTITESLAATFNLGPDERGLLDSGVLWGTVFGSCLSGYLGDVFGRRPPIIASLFVNALFSIIGSLAVSYNMLLFTRILVGVAMGVGQPAANTLVGEIAPSRYRPMLMSLALLGVNFGGLYCNLILQLGNNTDMAKVDWRRLLCLGALPAFVFGVLAFIMLPESPMYNCMVGKINEAEKLLSRLATSAGNSDMPVSFASPHTHRQSTPQDTMWHAMHVVFGRQLVLTTLIMFLLCICMFVAKDGTNYSLPLLLPHIPLAGSTPQELTLGSVFSISGGVIGIIVAPLLRRKTFMKVQLATLASACAAFAYGAPTPTTTWLSQVMIDYGYFGMKVVIGMAFYGLYPYAAEVYPTDARTFGVALVMSVGKAGGAMAPFIFEHVNERFGYITFYNGLALVCLLNVGLVSILAYETSGLQLRDDVADEFHVDAKLALSGKPLTYGAASRGPSAVLETL